MKALAPLAIAGALLTPGAALAATSGSLDANATVPYSCEVVTPSAQTMTVAADNSNASASAAFNFSQNDDTVYSLSALTFATPDERANIAGSVAIADANGQIVLNSSTSASASGNQLGNYDAQSGTVTFSISEITAPNFYAGDYSVGTTLSCAQAL